MSTVYYIKRNDTLPALDAQLTDANGVIDLTWTTVRLIARSGVREIIKPCEITVAAQGRVTVRFDPSDTTHTGHYHAEFEITILGSEKLTVHNDGYFSIIITEDL